MKSPCLRPLNLRPHALNCQGRGHCSLPSCQASTDSIRVRKEIGKIASSTVSVEAIGQDAVCRAVGVVQADATVHGRGAERDFPNKLLRDLRLGSRRGRQLSDLVRVQGHPAAESQDVDAQKQRSASQQQRSFEQSYMPCCRVVWVCAPRGRYRVTVVVRDKVLLTSSLMFYCVPDYAWSAAKWRIRRARLWKFKSKVNKK